MKTEIRKTICILLIYFNFWIMPTCDFKTKFATFLKQHLMDF